MLQFIAGSKRKYVQKMFSDVGGLRLIFKQPFVFEFLEQKSTFQTIVTAPIIVIVSERRNLNSIFKPTQ